MRKINEERVLMKKINEKRKLMKKINEKRKLMRKINKKSRNQQIQTEMFLFSKEHFLRT